MNTRIHLSMFLVVTFFLCGCGVEWTPEVTQDGPTALNIPGQHREVEIAPKHSAIYAVAEYDAERNAGGDLAATVEEASKGGKRIILEIGGNW